MKHRVLIPFVLITMFLINPPILGKGVNWPKDPLRASDEDMQWWREARFGMFITWGPVTLTGQEIGWSRGTPAWSELRIQKGPQGGNGTISAEIYDNLYKKWEPKSFDAENWVRLAKDAGQKYIIFLVKHHDGFCLYDTKLTEYKSTGAESAWKVDVMKVVADACHKYKMRIVVYYSQPDWHHPDYLSENHDRYIAYLHGQIRELLTNYGKIDGLWFDNLMGRGYNPDAVKLWDAENLFKMARSLQPHIIINDRCGLDADYYTPEQHIGDFRSDRSWESCITIGTQWSWKPDDKLKSAKQCIQTLISCAGNGGNLALNIGPMPDGQVEPNQIERFKEIGKWLKEYGESIYATLGGPFPPDGWGCTTQRENKIYVHILDWNQTPVLPSVQNGRKIIKASVLTGGTVELKHRDQGIEINVPPVYRRDIDTIVLLELDEPAAGMRPSKAVSGSLASGQKSIASSFVEGFAPGNAFDDDLGTIWRCEKQTDNAWLEVDLGKEVTFDSAFLSEQQTRVRKFELQYKDGDNWVAFADGKQIGWRQVLNFKPVTARFVRLQIFEIHGAIEANPGVSIREFRLFSPKKADE